jgi:hypothetical protein
LSVPFRNQRAKARILAKTIAREIFFSNSHPFEFALVLREFANHGTQQRRVVDISRTYAKHVNPSSPNYLTSSIPEADLTPLPLLTKL